jgi:hypothetical protein
MGKSSRIQGCMQGYMTRPGRARGNWNVLVGNGPKLLQAEGFQHYGLPTAMLPSTGVAGRPHQVNY